MAPATARQLLTVDDLDAMPEDDILRELVHGEVREWMAPGPDHGAIEAGLSSVLYQFVQARQMGVVMTGEVRFLIKGDVHHAHLADMAFVAAGKYPGNRPPRKADATQPDFVAEVISPDYSAVMVQEKVRDWLDTGVRLLWLLYPETRMVVVYRPGGTSHSVGHDGRLDAVGAFLP